MKNRRNIVLETIHRNVDALRKCGVRRLGIFGSAARNQVRPGSDLDFVVKLDRKSFDAYMDVKYFLERLFNRPIDLVLEDAIKPRLRPIIMKEVIHAAGL